jgi:hypothetical protein
MSVNNEYTNLFIPALIDWLPLMQLLSYGAVKVQQLCTAVYDSELRLRFT